MGWLTRGGGAPEPTGLEERYNELRKGVSLHILPVTSLKIT